MRTTPQPSAWKWWSIQGRSFFAAVLLVLSGVSQKPQLAMAEDLYPADFDPLYDLPLPPAWHETEDFAASSEALEEKIDNESKISVQVDLRLPAVDSDRLDEEQKTQWEEDQTAASQDLLDSLPDGSYERSNSQPASRMTLKVDQTALTALESSPLVANVKTSSADAKIAAGFSHSMVISSDGNLWAWGQNDQGQLGDGTNTDRNLPQHILSSVSAAAGGWHHSLALKTDGSLWAWGDNYQGQLGYGTTTDSPLPRRIITGGIAGMSAGQSHSVALGSDGSLWTWGKKLGYPLDGNNTSASPWKILSGVAAVTAGRDHSLALMKDGSRTIRAWGDNYYGQLGLGEAMTGNQITPWPIPNHYNFAAVAAGGEHSLAIKTDGSIWAWGRNNYGQLGSGVTSNKVVTPIKNSSLFGVASVAAGRFHSLALKTDGTLWAWGANDRGQLGDGTTNMSPKPKKILNGVAAIAAGGFHNIVRKNDGTLWAWGANDRGQLGDGTTTDRYNPVQITLPSNSVTLNVTKSGTGTVTSSPTGISCGSTCSYSFNSGANVTLTATAGSGYQFTGWSGACTNSSGTCTVSMTAAKSVAASFTPSTYALTVTKSGTGTVSSSPSGINCGSSCNYSFNSGASVTLTATAGTGYQFSGWTGACTNSTGTCTVSMTAAKSVTATFNALPKYVLSVKTSGTGTVTSSPTGINCGSTCSYSFTSGTNVTLTATAASGYQFSGWTGACTNTSGTCTVSMTAAKSVTATFTAPVKYALNVTKSGTGTVTSSPAGISCGSSCSYAFTSGTNVILTATAGSGYQFSGWTGACTNTSGTCTVSMTAAKSVTAKFIVSSNSCSSSNNVINVGTTTNGSLTTTDCKSTLLPSRYYDNFTFWATAGTTYTIDMTSSFKNWLYLLNNNGTVVAEYDNNYGDNARIVYRPLVSGALTIHATSYSAATTGSYTIALSGQQDLPPTAPSGLAATSASATQIKLRWIDNSSDEIGFYIERKTGSTGTYAQIGSVGAGVTSFTSSGLKSGTTYYYRVRAYNNNNVKSGYSNEAYAIPK